MKAIVNFIKVIFVTVIVLGVGYLAFATYFNNHAIENMGGNARAVAFNVPGDHVFIAVEAYDDEKIIFTDFFGNKRYHGVYAIPKDEYVDLGDGRFIDRTSAMVFK